MYERLGYLSESRSTQTLKAAIQHCLSDLELTDRQSEVVAARQKSLRDRAETNSKMQVDGSFLIGSYARDTQIRPISASEPALDVDAFLEMKPNQFNLDRYWHINDGGTKALHDLYDALKGFQGIEVKIDRPSISAKWQNMTMEICPAFPAKGGGYLIPSKDGSSKWIHTCPDLDAEALTSANKKCNNELKPLIKLIKSWNRNFGKELPSFVIETVAYHSAGTDYRGLEFELQWFFKRLLAVDGTFVSTPSGMGDKVFVNLSPGYKKLVEQTRNVLGQAFQLASDGNHRRAIELMGLVIGKPFPGV